MGNKVKALAPGIRPDTENADCVAERKHFFSRNRGLISIEDQDKLARTTIAIAGAGGDGGLLAERLVRVGIGGIILADPEVFEAANINRQFAANSRSLGRNKAAAVADELRLINPELRLMVYPQGLSDENKAEFIAGAHIVVDEIEYSLPSLSVLLHQEARRQQKPVFMGANIGWGASVFHFAPDGCTFEDHFEFDSETGTINPLKYLQTVPSYFDVATQQAILSGEMPMPSVSPAVGLVAAMLSTEIILFATGKKRPATVPEFLYADLYSGTLQRH
jgi:molybdopterin/thiamine biosynthesis adenylyltransferase